MIDIKSLVIGQEVYVLSGVYICKGRVVEITPSGIVHVRTKDTPPLHFDKDGREINNIDALEGGPWHLDDMPFAERTASLEQIAWQWQVFEKLLAVRIDGKAVDPFKLDKEQMQELVRRLEQQLAAAKAAVEAM